MKMKITGKRFMKLSTVISLPILLPLLIITTVAGFFLLRGKEITITITKEEKEKAEKEADEFVDSHLEDENTAKQVSAFFIALSVISGILWYIAFNIFGIPLIYGVPLVLLFIAQLIGHFSIPDKPH